MDQRHINAACAGVLLGCVSGAIVEVLFQGSTLRSAITLMLINGAVVGVASLVISIFKARRPPPP